MIRFMGNKYTEAQRRATEKYKKDRYARILLDIKKDFAEEVAAAAEAAGESKTKYITKAIRARMESDAGSMKRGPD